MFDVSIQIRYPCIYIYIHRGTHMHIVLDTVLTVLTALSYTVLAALTGFPSSIGNPNDTKLMNAQM